MPRLRSSVGTLSLLAVSTKGSLPTVIDPDVGASSPAMQFRVVDLPHPLGPSRVKNSPSSIVKLMSLSTATSPNCFDSLETCTSGIRVSLHEHARHGDEHGGYGYLDRGEGGNRAGVSLHPEVEHRGSDDPGVGRGEEQGRGVLLDHRDEHQDERADERRAQQRAQDAEERAEPVRAGGSCRVVQLVRRSA